MCMACYQLDRINFPQNKIDESRNMPVLNSKITSQFDIVTALSNGGFCHVVEKMLSYLDGSSLAKAELVCRQWKEAIAGEHLWQKLFLIEMRQNFSWIKLSSRRIWMQEEKVRAKKMKVNKNLCTVKIQKICSV